MVEPVDGWAEALAADRRRPDAHCGRFWRAAGRSSNGETRVGNMTPGRARGHLPAYHRSCMSIWPTLALCGLAGTVALGCGGPPERQLCEAIARRDLAAARLALGRGPVDMQKNHGGCVPIAAVFGLATPEDTALTEIGVELVKAGMPADASWIPAGTPTRVWAVEAVANNGNVALLRALIAVGLDVKSPAAGRALLGAASAGRLAVVTLLVQEGVPLEPAGGETPMARALANGHADVVEFLNQTATAQAAAAEQEAQAAQAGAARP